MRTRFGERRRRVQNGTGIDRVPRVRVGVWHPDSRADYGVRLPISNCTVTADLVEV